MPKAPYLKIRKQDGILYCDFTYNIHLDLETARNYVEQRLLYSEGTSYPVCINMTKVKSVDREARAYLAKEGAALITAGALITNSPLSNFIANIFLSLNKPTTPSRLFTNEKDACDWLKNYINCNYNYAPHAKRQTA